MNSNVISAITRLERVYGALGCEPEIRPDPSGLTRDYLPVVLLALMNRGLRTLAALESYLTPRGAPFDFEGIMEALDEGLAEQRTGDGGYDGLWLRDGVGDYTPTIFAGY